MSEGPASSCLAASMPSSPAVSQNTGDRFHPAFSVHHQHGLLQRRSFLGTPFSQYTTCTLHPYAGQGKRDRQAPPVRYNLRKFELPRLLSLEGLRRTAVSARGPESEQGKTQAEDVSRKSLLNRVLASRNIALSFIGASGILYIVAICLVGKAISSVSILAHQRIVLLGLGILLPDFRHVLKSYSEAVQHLQKYKPAFQGFRFGSKLGKDAQATKDESALEGHGSEESEWDSQPHLVWLSDAMRQLREKIDVNAEKFDALLSSFSRDMSRPIVETSTQIQQLTTGTDLTLRKNVVVAAASVFLSLAGYLASAAGEATIGGVAIMLASLLPNAILSPRKHEMLALIHDTRVAISLIGTLSCAVSVFFPMTAAYCFLLCCVALVVTRLPVDWMLKW